MNIEQIRLRGPFWTGMLVIVLVASVARGALDAGQTRLLNDARAQLKQMQTNLKLAQDSAGGATGRPSPAQAKLAMARLSSAKGSMAQVQARLDKLPATDSGVKSLHSDFDAVATEIKQLEARLTSAAAAPPAPGNAPAAPVAPAPGAPAPVAAGAGSGVKMDYRQQQSLKDAQFNINQLAGAAKSVAEVVEQAKAAPDQSKVDARQVQGAMGTLTEARRKLKFATDRMDALPANGAGVAEAAAELKAVITSLDASEQSLRPLLDTLTKLLDPANYKELNADLKRLRELAGMYANTSLLKNDPVKSIALINDAPAAKQEVERITRLYAPLVAQQTDAGKQIEGGVLHFTERSAAFAEAAANEKQSLPQEIDADLSQIDQMAQEAVKEQKPAFFSGGIPPRVERAEQKVALYAALDAEGAKASQQKLVEARERLKTAEAALVDSIIASNELPPDRYTAGDRQSLTDLATAAWKKLQPQAQVLMARIPSENWKRETMWRNQNGSWYQIDRSKVQVQLLVKHTDQLVVVRAIDLWKDHLQNDQINAAPMDDGKSSPAPRNLIPVQKVK